MYFVYYISDFYCKSDLCSTDKILNWLFKIFCFGEIYGTKNSSSYV